MFDQPWREPPSPPTEVRWAKYRLAEMLLEIGVNDRQYPLLMELIEEYVDERLEWGQ